MTQRADEVIYVKSPHPPLPYAVKLTERLEHWAGEVPKRTFFAQRDTRDEWRQITYADALQRVRGIAQALIDRKLPVQTPVLILSGNSIEHALLALGCMYAGVLYAPIAPSYSLAFADRRTLRYLWKQFNPALVFAYDGETFEQPLRDLLNSQTELVTVKPPRSLRATSFVKLATTVPSSSADRAHALVTGDTIAKVLFTSGSTGEPKGVITTQRMLCSNQQMIRSTMSFLADEPPVLCDWLPWNHVFGGSHNFGIALYNGGTFYIDEGKPTLSGFATTLANLRDVSTTAYFNVPKAYRMLVPALRADPAFNQRFFRRLKVVLCAGAGLHHSVWDELQRLALEAGRQKILMINALGSTESAPMALVSASTRIVAGQVGLPVPGVELKLVPVGDKLEARLRGPNITPGFWRDPERTAAAFDDEGFFRTGDALRYVDAERPLAGFCFDGRLDGNFKLSTGTWVDADALRAKLLAHLVGLAEDILLAGPDRDYVVALIFPSPGATREDVGRLLSEFAFHHKGLSKHVQRALLLDEQPSVHAGEITDKGTVNQETVLRNRAVLVQEIYTGSLRVIEIATGQQGERHLAGER